MPAVIKKRAIISRSGIYRYHVTELPRFNGLGPMPEEHKSRSIFNIYRPASVIQDSASLLRDLPITIEHPGGSRVDGDNFQDLTVGWTSDSATIVPIADGQEIGIETELNLVDNKAKRHYKNGFREVSPNYDAVWRWANGVSPDGQEYQIIMDRVLSADSLAMTKKGRGGVLVAIQDSAFEENDMKTGFWRRIRKLFSPVGDSHMEFNAQLGELVSKRKEWTPAMISDAVEKLRKFCDDLPVSDKKEILLRTISDLWDINNILNTDEAVESGAKQIADLYAELDSDADKEMSDIFGDTPVGDEDMPPEVETSPAPTNTAPPASPADNPPPSAPGTGDPAVPPAPTAAAPMDIKSIPLDKTQWSDDMIAFIIMEALKFLQAQAPEAAAPPAVEGANTEAPPTAAPVESETPPAPAEEPPKKEPTGDSSPFRQALRTSRVAGKSISEFSSGLTARRSAK